MKNVVEYTISKHAKERYAERICGKEDSLDINRYVSLNENKIKEDINKLINYGDCIFTGRQYQKDGKGNVVNVYLNQCWIILVDMKNNVITLYKVDLGLDDEFNKAYVTKMVEKLNKHKEDLKIIQQQVQEESNIYRELIAEAESQIKEYKGMIKNLEELCVGYKTIIDNNCVKITQANRNVAETVNTLISKKEF